LKRVVPRLRLLLFTRKKRPIYETGRSQEHIKNGLKPKCLWNLPTPPSPPPSTSSTVKTPNHKKNPDDPEPADEGHFQMEYSSD